MTANRGRIETLIMRMQGDFLDRPGLELTLPKAQKRFGVDETTCEAVLDVLTDASVLARTHEGAYVRLFPRLVGRPPEPVDFADNRGHRHQSAKHAA